MKNMSKYYITTAIPYINAKPHIGHAMEFIQTDVLARFHRIIGDDTYFLTGSDDNSLKNVLSAEAAGINVDDFVKQHAEIFKTLATTLNISNDDFIRTVEERHKLGVEKLWEACKKDIYKKTYKGRYCVGCEEFKKVEDLDKGCCPEHPNKPLETIEEENYFFKLSNYQKKLEELIEKDEYKIVPETRKNEVLSFIKRGLEDFSVSRSQERAKGWGIPVPGDPSQVIYVWFDALGNYITALGYGTGDKLFDNYWPADAHVVGKGITKFHAIYWPAMLLSAGVALPKKLFVHGYFTVDGQKMSKSLGNVIDPEDLVLKYGVDAVRYFLLREIPSTKDGDFSIKRFEERFTSDLSNELGNLVQRTLTMINKYEVKVKYKDSDFPSDIASLIKDFSFDKALVSIWTKVKAQNQFIEENKPWELAKNDKQSLADVLTSIYSNLCEISVALSPFMPDTSKKIKEQLNNLKPEAIFPRLEK
ncbi:methionine--tRNA ligase [bacterium]|nr:methionine--tRNA ligase [bacterium]